ncbi:MAG: efflux RND transporter periplasmic adaptor subunit [Bacteroidales bacterium]|nr:efflux RND transporter periplasmic adaptor subunit [Bacteroidales bacterium]
MKRVYLLFIAFSLLLLSCQHVQDQQSSVKAPVPVKVLVTEMHTIVDSLNYVGKIEKSRSSILSFETGGNIVKIYCRDGQRVNEGDLLASVDKSNAQNTYNAAKATYDRAQDAYDRAKKVYDNGSLSEIKWQEIVASLLQAKSLAEIAQNNLKKTDLYAPISGTINSIAAKVGMNVLPYQSVMEIIDLHDVMAVISVPEKEIFRIKGGQKGVISVSAMDDAKFDGKVVEKGIIGDAMSHTYTVKVSFDSTRDLPLPGMICNVRLAFEGDKSCVVVPLNCIQLDRSGKCYVWIEENNVAARRQIVIGEIVDNGVCVMSGLSDGTKVISSGFLKIGEGSKVIVQ